MGYMRSHAILVTDSGYGEHIDDAHREAVKLAMHVTDVVRGSSNGVRSFACLPDGSKEGWGHSDEGDEKREAFVAYLRSTVYEDGSGPLSWVEMQYGDDERVTRVLRSSDADRRRFLKRALAAPETDNG